MSFNEDSGEVGPADLSDCVYTLATPRYPEESVVYVMADENTDSGYRAFTFAEVEKIYGDYEQCGIEELVEAGQNEVAMMVVSENSHEFMKPEVVAEEMNILLEFYSNMLFNKNLEKAMRYTTRAYSSNEGIRYQISDLFDEC